MKKKIKVIYNMLVVVDDYFGINKDVVAEIPALKPIVSLLTDSVVQIKSLDTALDKHPKKPAAEKGKIQVKLNRLMELNSSKHVSYAVSIDNLELEDKVTLTKADVAKLDNKSRLSFAKSLYDLNQENLTALATFGITPATQTDFQTTIAAFEAVIPKAREHVSSAAATLADLEDLILESYGLLNNKIDKLVRGGADLHPEFVDKYFNNRKLVQLPTFKLALKGVVTITGTGEPIRGVTVNLGDITVRSTPKGNFQVANHEPGMIRIQFSKPGFVSKTVEAVIGVPGETTELSIELDAA